MNDDVQSELLDKEFRQILIAIKPYINHIDDHYHLEYYRIWLERLSNAHYREKVERNKYLLELANQIQDNILEPPFTYHPPKGLLPRMKNYHRIQLEDDPAQISEPFFQKDQNQWPFTPKTSSDQKSKSNTWPQKRNNKPIKTKMIRPFQKLGIVGQGEETKNEESNSWDDLTESASHGDTDLEDNEKKIVGTQHRLEGLKTREEFAKKYEEEQSKKSQQSSFDVQKFLSEEKPSRKPTPQELDALKMRMKDLLEVKNALRDTHCLTEDRKKTIEKLERKLAEVEREKEELQVLLEAQKKKFIELDKIKNKEIGDFKDRFGLLRKKEVEYLKKYHKEEVISLEKSYSVKIIELQGQINNLKRDYEERIKNLSESNVCLLREKEKKIQELQNELKMKESQSVRSANAEQVLNLKKCLSKLDKVLHRNEKDYNKKIEILKQELDMKEVTSKVQLQAQKADIIVRTSAAKQEELRNALNSLEGKYKKMLECVQSHASQMKKQDEKLIEELKDLLHRNNIVF